MKTLLLGTVCALALALAIARADLSLSAYVDGVQVGPTVTSATGTADLNLANPDVYFRSIQVSAAGVPALASPDLASDTLNVTANALVPHSVHDLKIIVLQTGLAPYSGPVALTGTYDQLLGSGAAADETTDADGLSLLTESLSGPSSAFGPVVEAVSALVSDAQVYDMTFDGSGQSVIATMELRALSDPPVVALLIGAVLAALGWRRRRGLARAAG